MPCENIFLKKIKTTRNKTRFKGNFTSKFYIGIQYEFGGIMIVYNRN